KRIYHIFGIFYRKTQLFGISPIPLTYTLFSLDTPRSSHTFAIHIKQKNMANQFLVKETMVAMRGLSAAEITSLQNGTYEGVQLLGYYEKGDTPTPIEYYLTTTGTNNNGDTITTGSIILKANFEGKIIDALYYGISSTITTNNTQEQLQHLFNSKAIAINLPKGVTIEVSETLEVKTDNCVIRGNGFTLRQKDNSGMLGTGNGGKAILQLKG